MSAAPAPDLPPNLVYTTDDTPGYQRVRKGRGFAYQQSDGTYVRDKKLKRRFAALGIPPAYTDVWICPRPNGHLQASGRDERGRKQYLYHPAWTVYRNEAKFRRLADFGRALEAIRARTDHDLRRHAWDKDKVVALAVRLLDATLMRVGNAEYTAQNASYGLTTLRDEHVSTGSTKVSFAFRGKSGVSRRVTLRDRRLARLVRRCAELPGQELLQYTDGTGAWHALDSADINEYLQETTEEAFTAKDFRTWGANVLAVEHWEDARAEAEAAPRKKLETCLVRRVAKSLGNTVAVCRSYYLHPAVLRAAVETPLGARLAGLKGGGYPWLTPEEGLVMKVIERS